MRVFFDNCTSPILAAVLAAYVAHDGHEAHHVRDMPCGRHADDLIWISMLAQTGDQWMVVTGDLRIQRNKAERMAFRSAGLRGFVLARAFQKTPLNEVAAALLWQWPAMCRLMELTAGAALHELSINRSSRFRPVPL